MIRNPKENLWEPDGNLVEALKEIQDILLFSPIDYILLPCDFGRPTPALLALLGRVLSHSFDMARYTKSE